MRLISYRVDGDETWGVLHPTSVVGRARIDESLPATLAGFIARCEANPGLRQAVAERAHRLEGAPLEGLGWLPLIPRPGKIVCLGLNYREHAAEGGNKVGDYPTLFMRCATSLLAHEAPLIVPAASDKLDYEAELAVVIGRRTRHVAASDALASVFGYTCFNDATLRDYQRRTSQWTIGKNFDATGAFGPALVTADELPPGAAGLRIRSRLNGQTMQDANTADMVFDVAQTIALLSECLTLEAGDVIVTGTPSGVGYARTPPLWMKAGDVIEVEIDRIGCLRNPVQGAAR